MFSVHGVSMFCAESDFRQAFFFKSDFPLSSLTISPLSLPHFSPSNNKPFLSDFQRAQLKQMKELEQEKDSLLAGLEVVERARDWYQGQIHNVTERQRQVGQSSHCTVRSKTHCQL